MNKKGQFLAEESRVRSHVQKMKLEILFFIFFLKFSWDRYIRFNIKVLELKLKKVDGLFEKMEEK